MTLVLDNHIADRVDACEEAHIHALLLSKPEEEDEGVRSANTAANSSQAAAGNAATSKQSERPETVDGAGNVGPGPNSPQPQPVTCDTHSTRAHRCHESIRR
jgi:hypothetical protein